MVIRFVPHAEAELTKARKWYAHQRVGLDLELMQCIDEALSRVVANPQSFPLVYGNLRRIVVRRFPFAIFYEVTGNEINVIGVFHSRRDPELWQSRIS